MASSTESDGSSTVVNCECQKKACIRITKSDKNGNRGRPYYTCGFVELGIKKCEYFRWCQNDVDDNEFRLRRDNMIANQRLQRLESEVAELKVLVQQGREAIKVLERLDNEVAELKVLVQQGREAIKVLERLDNEVAELKVLVQQGREAVKVVENETGWIKVMGVVVFFLVYFFL
ncbi:uncharacterized protein LOC143856888 isoform X1 [Tasmannia lanceolata]|uniref:uncharacterized protein LOC143856888 isoform X1 n=1 Tax=Tasmannia lanceolata TaxID=3420 RepID=UPI0040635F0A